MTKQIFKFAFWLLALLGLFNIFQALWVYTKIPEVTGVALVRNDPVEAGLSDIFCGPDRTGQSELVDFALLSALAYPSTDPALEAHLQGRWTRIDVPDGPGDDGDRYLQVWENGEDESYVIAFRGTQRFADWHANLHWIAKYFGLRTRYQEVHAAMPALVKYLRDKRGTQVSIATTGHSLGGGLAQHALYSSSHITEAVVFNSSPVTGWHDLDPVSRSEAVRGNRVIRFHESGEVLAPLRYLMRLEYALNPLANKNPYFEEYRVNFRADRRPLKFHEMAWMFNEMLAQVHLLCRKAPA